MDLALHLYPRQSCISCPDPVPCNCPATQKCVRQIQTCSSCAQNVCVDNANSIKKASTTSGALIGAIVACVILLLLVGVGLWLWRRRARRAQEQAAATLEKSISPFDLNGPPSIHSVVHTQSPTTPVMTLGGSPPDVRIYTHSNGNLNSSPGMITNPFNDSASMSTMSTNVIPIAFVPPSSTEGGHSSPTHLRPPNSPTGSLNSGHYAPSRPERAANMVDLRLRDEVRDGVGELRAPKQRYAQSTRSGISNRSSIFSTTSSVLYERPTIVTSAKVGRQILGVVRAEVVPVGSTSTPSSPMGVGRSVSLKSRPSIRSPLAGKGYTASEAEEEVPPVPNVGLASPAMSTRSDPFSDTKIHQQFNPAQYLDPSNLPLPASTNPSPTSPNMHADYPPLQPPRHLRQESQASFASGTSHADSIMNAFTFLPPSPALPQGFVLGRAPSIAASSVVIPDGASGVGGASLARRATNYSVMSSSSGMSNGLGDFHFQFGGDAPAMPTHLATAAAPGSFAPPRPVYASGPGSGQQRASLDTLALSRDVDEYALPYER